MEISCKNYWIVSECECDARGRQNGISCGNDFCFIKSNLEGKSCKTLTGEIINNVIPGRWVKCEQNGRRLIKCPEGNRIVEVLFLFYD